MSRLRNTAALVQVMTVSCPRLEWLHLAGCGWIRPEALEYHAQHHFRHHQPSQPAGTSLKTSVSDPGPFVRIGLFFPSPDPNRQKIRIRRKKAPNCNYCTSEKICLIIFSTQHDPFLVKEHNWDPIRLLKKLDIRKKYQKLKTGTGTVRIGEKTLIHPDPKRC